MYVKLSESNGEKPQHKTPSYTMYLFHRGNSLNFIKLFQ